MLRIRPRGLQWEENLSALILLLPALSAWFFFLSTPSSKASRPASIMPADLSAAHLDRLGKLHLGLYRSRIYPGVD